MIKVDNKKTIRHIADTSFRANRMRNLFAIVAICLTTILFCGVFTIVSSLLATVEESTMRQVGTSAHGGFKYLTAEEYEKLSRHSDIKEISYSVILGIAENEELVKRQTEIRYANDELEAQMSFAMPTTGRMPQEEDEIATDTLVLEKLGVPANLGETVTIKYSVAGEEYTENFTLVGFWDGDIIASVSQVWLSRTYVEEILSRYGLQHDGFRQQNDSCQYNDLCQHMENVEAYVGSINADVNFRNAWNIESKLIKVITESGYSLDDIEYGVNWAYEDGSSMDVGTILGAVLIVTIIIFSGYLMISNIFLISVTKDVRFYGLLKTIGTTGKQIKVLIRRQAMRIFLIGISIGLLLGSLAGGMLTPMILGILNTNVIKVSIKWWVFLFAAEFAWMTVFISIRKASKIAAGVSPMEALRTSDATDRRKKKQKTGQKISLWKMAWDNVWRNRKKSIFVIISLSLSLIILNGAYTMADSFDMEAYLSQMISHDFVLGDVSCFNVYAQYTNQDTISPRFLEELSAKSGIESMEKIYFAGDTCALDEHWADMAERAEKELQIDSTWLSHMREEIESGTAVYHVYGIDDAVWEDFTVWQGEINPEKLHSGNYAVVSPYDTEGKLSAYEVGDTIDVFSEDGESRSCEIIAIASIPYNISIQHSHPVDINIYLASDVFLEQVAQKCPMLITLDVEDSAVDAMEQYLSDYCRTGNPSMQYTSRALYADEYKATQSTYKMVGVVAGILLALIGIANFANTSITSIIARKHEFAVLESIGMTAKQQRKILMLEGLNYMLLTFGFTWTLGTVLGKLGLMMLLSESEYFVINFTILPSVICMPMFLLLVVAIPLLSRKYANGGSVVERLRVTE